MNTRIGRVLPGLVLALGWVVGATDVMAQDRLSELEDRVGRLEAELAALKSEIRSLRQEKDPARGSDPPSARVNLSDGGLIVESPDRKLGLRLQGTYQIEARAFFGDDIPVGSDTIEPRRIRPIFQMRAGRLTFRVAPEFGRSHFDLYDAYANWELADGQSLSFGKMKPPIGLERLQAAPAVTLAERGLTSELIPRRDVGLMFRGLVFNGKMEYAAGIFDGAPDNALQLTDTDNGKDLVFRVFAHPWKSAHGESAGPGIGLGGNVGNHVGPTSSFSSSARLPFFQYVTGALTDGRTWRLAPQADLYEGPLGLMTEFVVSSQEIAVQEAGGRLTNSAWQLLGSYVLTGEDASYYGVRPRHEFSPREGYWGAFEVAARVDQLKVDRAAFPLFADPTVSAQKATGLGMGLNWYPTRLIRVTIDYETTSVDLLAGKRPREHAFTSRLQFAY